MRAARTDRKEVVEKVLRGLQCSTGSKGWVPRIVGWEGVDAEKCTYGWCGNEAIVRLCYTQ